MSQHTMPPIADSKFEWTTDGAFGTGWECVRNVRKGAIRTSTDGARARFDVSPFTLAGGETATAARFKVYGLTTPAGRTATLDILNGTTSIANVGVPAGLTNDDSYSVGITTSLSQSDINNLKVQLTAGTGTGQVEAKHIAVWVTTSGGPLLVYDNIFNERFQQNNNGDYLTNWSNSNLSNGVGIQGGDEWEGIDLGGNRILWIASDTVYTDFVGINRNGSDPINGPLIHSCFGLQVGRDLADPDTTLDWYPGHLDDGQIASFLDCVAIDGVPFYRWPHAGIVLDGEVLLIMGSLMQTELDASGFGTSQAYGTFASLIYEIDKTPDQWVEVVVPVGMETQRRTNWGDYLAYGGGRNTPPFAGMVDSGDGYIRSWAGTGAGGGPSGGPSDLWLPLRFDKEKAKKGDLRRIEWWDGAHWTHDKLLFIGGGARRKTWQRRLRAAQAVKRRSDPFFMTFGEIFKRADDSKWVMTAVDFWNQQVWYGTSDDPQGPFWPFTSAGGKYGAYASILCYGGMSYPEQTFPGKGAHDLIVGHTTGGAVGASPLYPWPAFYRLTLP